MAKYRFGDIVREVKDKVDRDNNPYEYYIAGDHMDTDELHLLRRGAFEGSDVGPAFIRIFKPGQVLYGSRRTYLRKVAVADFEGVTANTTFVLESKDETILLQSLLPFIMQADRFVQHSIKRSKGSTNPYVLFSDLADYEVNLPSIEEQRKLSDLLWAIDGVKMSYKKLISATDDLVKSQFIEMFGNPLTNDKRWPTKKMKEVAPSSPHTSKIEKKNNGYWLLNLDMVESNSGRIIEKIYVPEDEIGQSTTTFSKEYVLYSKLRPYLNKVVIPNDSGYATTELIPLLPNQRLLTQLYLAQLLRGDEFLTYISTQVSGTKMPRVTMNVFWDFNVMLPPMELQEQFAEFVRQSDKSKFELEQALSELTATYKRIISDNLG